MPEENTNNSIVNRVIDATSIKSNNKNGSKTDSLSSNENTGTVSGPSTFIPIGFGLEGYQIKATDNNSGGVNASGAGGIYSGGGASVDWNDVTLVDDRWVSDESLKQVVVQCTCFQSAPLKYESDEGTTYLNLGDGIDKWDYDGSTAFGVCIGGMCDNKLESPEKWDKKLNGRDFDAGCGICPTTLAHYLNHFYGMSETYETAVRLLAKRIVNAEVLYNTGQGTGKAFRLRIVDSAGKAGYKGGPDNCKGQKIRYDILDTNVSVLLTKGFEDVMRWKSKKLGEINSGKLDFPWKDVVYDYTTGTIPGYSAAEIKKWKNNKFRALDVGIVSSAIWTATTNNGAGLPTARVRFFVDEKDLATAKQVMPTLPDEFAKTNYANGSAQAMADVNLDGFESVGAGIFAMAQKISDWCQRDMKGKWSYSKDAADGASNAARPATYLAQYGWKYEPVCAKQWKMCCGSYVWWVLAELGITKGGSVYGSRAAETTASNVQTNLAPGYKAVSIGKDITKAQPGDILVFGIGTSHIAIYDTFRNGKIVEYGMGKTTWMDGSVLGSHGGRGTAPLKDLIRIVKDGGGASTNGDGNNSGIA